MSEKEKHRIVMHARVVNFLQMGEKERVLAAVFQKGELQFGMIPLDCEYLVFELSTGVEVLRIPKYSSGMFDVYNWNLHCSKEKMDNNKNMLEITLQYPLNEKLEL